MEFPQNERDLSRLVSRIQDGLASRAELRWLERAVAVDARIRRAYLEMMDLESELLFQITDRCAESSQSTQSQLLVDLESVFAGSPDAAGPPVEAGRWRVMSATFEVAVSHISAGLARAIAWHRHPLRFLSTSAVLTLLLWGAWAAFVLPRGQGVEVAERPGPPKATQEVRFVARIVGGNAQWSEASGYASSGAFLRQGQALELQDGWARLRFRTGAIVTLQSPARFVVLQENRIELIEGLGKVEVRDDTAKGFAVSAPGGIELVDLGTQFVVDVQESDGETVVDAKVVEGRVRVSVASGDSRVLAADESVRVEGGQVKTMVASVGPMFVQPPTVVSVDLGPGSLYRGPGAAPDRGTFWNNGATATDAAYLLASDGRTRTGIGFKSDRQAHGQRQGAKISLFDDYQFTHRGSGDFTLTIGGLDRERRYDVYLYTATTLTQGTACSIDGQTKTMVGADHDRFIEGENYVRFVNVAPRNGEIQVTLRDNGAEFSAGLLNGFQVVERAAETQAPPPAPADDQNPQGASGG